MGAHPDGGVERRGESVSRRNGGDEALLEGTRRRKPQLAQQHIARGEAVIEGAGRRLEPRRHGFDRDRRRPALGRQRTCGGEEIRIGESRAWHRIEDTLYIRSAQRFSSDDWRRLISLRFSSRPRLWVQCIQETRWRPASCPPA